MFQTYLTFLLICSTFGTYYPEVSNLTNKETNFPFHGQMYSGFIVVDNETQANLFYLLYAFNQTTLDADAPLMIWFNGGPGCSSLIGAFSESGPVLINLESNNTFAFFRNNFTWNNYAHSLFIDQPAGTGFSVANGLNVSSAEEAAPYINIFLARFYQLFPMLKYRDLYIFGESYAGKYVPYFAQYLLKNETFRKEINLKGVGIGDGWAFPVRQIRTWSEVGYIFGIIDQKVRDVFSLEGSQAFNYSENNDFWDTTIVSNNIQNQIADWTGNVTTLDFRQFGIVGESFGPYLNSTDGQNLLGVPPTDYSVCSEEVSDDFFDDITMDVGLDVIPYVISQLPVIFYVGQDDLGCDYNGILSYLNELDWTGVIDFRYSERKVWHLDDGSIAGLSKESGNLSFVLFYKSGHMVPLYQPEAASEMINNFLHKKPFD